MGVTVEEIEILVKANIKDALAGMTQLRSELKKVLSAQLPNIQSQIAPTRRILDQYGNTIYSSAKKAQTATQGAGDAIKRNAQVAQQAAAAEKTALEAVAAEHEKINRLVREQAAAHDAARASEAETARASMPTVAPTYPSKTATEILAERNTSAKKTDNTPIVDQSQLSGWQKLTARYYTALDNVKAALNKAGLYGQESIGTVKKQTDAAITATKRYGDQVNRTTKQSSSMFGNLGTIIKHALISVAVYQGVRWLYNTIKEGIQNAIDAPEIENLFRVAFGKAGDQASAFADKLHEAIGVDTYATKQMLGTFQELETSMGVGQKTAVKMSESLSVLANDIASLYNVDPEQASENLQSALTGQWRAVRKYGFTLSEATIQQAAYNHGLAQAGAELTEQQKVIARYLALMDQSKNAQGDAARTINSVANQLRVLKQNFIAAGRSIGTAFIPFIQSVLPWLNAFMIVLQRVGVQLSRWTYSLFGMDYDAEMKKQQQTIVTGLNAVTDAQKSAGGAAKQSGKDAEDAAKKWKGGLADFDEIKVIQQPDTDENKNEGTGAEGAGAGAGGLDFDVPTLDVSKGKNPAEELADRIQTAFAKIREAAKPTEEAFGRLVKSLEPLKNFAAKGLEDFYKDFLVPVGKWVLGNGLPEFFDIIARFNNNVNWGAINKALDDFWKALAPFAIHVGEGLLWFMDNVLRPLGEWTMSKVVPAFLEILANAIKVLDSVLVALQPLGQWLFDNFLKPIAEWTGGVIVSVLNGIADGLGKTSDWINANQGAVQNMAKVVAAFFAAWEVTKVFAFIEISGGVIGALKAITTALAGATIAKTIDKAETVILTVLYAKDFVVSVAASTAALVANAAQWVAATAVKVADTVAQVAATAAVAAWNAICVVATAVTKAFGVAMAFLTSPIGLVVIGIAAVIAIVVLLIKHWDEVKEAGGKAWDWIQGKWNGAGEWFHSNVVQPIAKFFSSMWSAITSAASAAWNGIVVVWNVVSSWFDTNVITPVRNFFVAMWEAIKTAAQTAWNGVSAIWSIVSNWFNSNVIQPVANFFSEMWKAIQSAAQNAWNGIVAVWNVVSGWFNTNIIQPVGKFFADLWSGISGASGKAWTAISDVWKTVSDWFHDKVISPIEKAFKGSINFLIGLAEGFANSFVDAINAVIRLLNRIHFDIPDWVPKIGGKSFGIDISTMGHVSIPRLEAGAVLKQSTIANLAEYPGAAQNPEIASPQSLMYDTVVDANGPLAVEILNELESLKEAVVTAISNKDTSVNIDGTSLDRALRPIRQAEDRRIGKALFEV